MSEDSDEYGTREVKKSKNTEAPQPLPSQFDFNDRDDVGIKSHKGTMDLIYAVREYYVNTLNDEASFDKLLEDLKDQNKLMMAAQIMGQMQLKKPNVMDEIEFVQFVQMMIQNNVTTVQIPNIDPSQVMQYYYVFNGQTEGSCHAGVSLKKISLFQNDLRNANFQMSGYTSLLEQEVTSSSQGFGVAWKAFIVAVIVAFFIYCDPNAIRGKLDKMNGFISNGMIRVVMKPSNQKYDRLYKNKIYYGDDSALTWGTCEADEYWNEKGKIDLSQKAEEQLMEASFELHNMALEAVDKIVNDDTLMTLFYINKDLWPAIRESWKIGRVDFQGRFDLAFDGKNPPKLIEYNADTPSLQLESSVLSDDWLNEQIKNKGQNNIHQANYMQGAYDQGINALIGQCSNKRQYETYNYQKKMMPMSIGVVQNGQDEENVAVMQYFHKMIQRQTQSVQLQDIDKLKITYENRGEINVNGNKKVQQCGAFWEFTWGYKRFECLFSIYPKEWMIDETGDYPFKKYDFRELRSIEPYWKLLLGNKALLPLLWSMYPNHPNLLAAFYDNPKKQMGSQYKNIGVNDKQWVSKPLFGREGMGIFFSSNFTNYDQFVQTTERNFGVGKNGNKMGQSIYQEEVILPHAQGRVIQTGSWIINGMPAGIIFREGKAGKHFEDGNPFLLHTVRGKNAGTFKFRMTKEQQRLRNRFYKSLTGQSQQNLIYNKYGGKVKMSIVSKDTFSKTKTHKSFAPYTQWISYQQKETIVKKQINYEKNKNPELSSLDAGILRCESKGYATDVNYKTTVAYLAFKKNWGQCKLPYSQKFGRVGKLDNSGRGYWFSVDTHGRVRTHHYSSSGFGRS